jgi:hypothetical protein
MKAHIVITAAANESLWRVSDLPGTAGKKTSPITVKGEDGNHYQMWIMEGGKYWHVAPGTELDIEVTEPATPTRKGKAKAASQWQGKGGQPYTRREWQTPTPEKAKEAADFTANLFKAMRGRLPELESDSVALLVGKLIEKLC